MNLQRGQSAPTPRRRKDDVAPGMPRPVNGAVAAGNDDRPFFRLNLRRALQLHRRLAMGIALAGLVLALAYVALTWPVYTAQSRIYIQPAQSKVMTQDNDQGGSINPAAYDSFVQQQVQSALTNASSILAHTDTNLEAILIHLSDITSNLNAQVQANTNLLGGISKAVTDADDLVQGLKRHWLLRSAFKTKATNAPAKK